MDQNHVHLCGRLGRDPEMRYTPSGTAVCNFSIAISSWSKKKDEEGFDKQVVWIDITAWGKNAERAGEQARKGTEALIYGRLDTRSWDDKDDPSKKHFRTFVTAINVQFGHGRIAADQQEASPETLQSETSPAQQEDKTPPANTTGASQAASASEEEDDLPF